MLLSDCEGKRKALRSEHGLIALWVHILPAALDSKSHLSQKNTVRLKEYS